MSELDVTVIVGTFGDPGWQDLATKRAIPSAETQATTIATHGETLAQARNWGAEAAGSEWLCFLDADDELAPGYMDAMAAADGDLRGPAVVYVRNGRRMPPKLWPAGPLTDRNYLVIGTLIRRGMFLEAGGFEEWPLYEDWALWARCSKLGAHVVQVPSAVYVAYVTHGSRNHGPSRAEKERWHHEIRRAVFPELYEAAA